MTYNVFGGTLNLAQLNLNEDCFSTCWRRRQNTEQEGLAVSSIARDVV